jgi:hypothetical protein
MNSPGVQSHSFIWGSEVLMVSPGVQRGSWFLLGFRGSNGFPWGSGGLIFFPWGLEASWFPLGFKGIRELHGFPLCFRGLTVLLGVVMVLPGSGGLLVLLGFRVALSSLRFLGCSIMVLLGLRGAADFNCHISSRSGKLPGMYFPRPEQGMHGPACWTTLGLN